MGEQRGQGGLGIAPEVDLHRVAQAEVAREQVDLDSASLTGRREELAVREVRADHQQGVAVLHHVVAGLRAEQTELLGVMGNVAGNHRLAQQRGDYSGAQAFGHGEHFIGGSHGPLTDEHRHLAAGVEHGRRLCQFVIGWGDPGGSMADAGTRHEVLDRRVPPIRDPARRRAG